MRIATADRPNHVPASDDGAANSARATALFAVILFIWAAGCAGVRYAAGEPLTDERLAADMHARMGHARPAAVRAVQRTILTKGARQIAMTCYIRARQPNDVRMIGLDDLGNTLFDAERASEEGGEIERIAPGIPPGLIVDGALRDAHLVYLARPSKRARLVGHADGSVGLIDVLNDGSQREFRFDHATGMLTRILQIRHGRCTYEAEFDFAAPLEKGDPPTLQAVRAVDYLRRYEAAMQIVEMGPLDVTDGA